MVHVAFTELYVIDSFNGKMGERNEKWMDGWVDESMDKLMDEQMDENSMN